MKARIRCSIALVALFFGTPTFAADTPAKTPAEMVSSTWTGCFAGGNAGGGRAKTSFVDALTVPPIDLRSHTGSSGVGGGQIGCDYQSGSWVIGLQGMLDVASFRGRHVYATSPVGFNLVVTGGFLPGIFAPGATESLTTRIPWLATLTGRLGYVAQPMLLLYVRGGAAWVPAEHTVNISGLGTVAEGKATRTGWTVGAGAEYLLATNWSLFAEYNYLGLGTKGILFASVSPIATSATAEVTQNIHLALVGVSYRFNRVGPLLRNADR